MKIFNINILDKIETFGSSDFHRCVSKIREKKILENKINIFMTIKYSSIALSYVFFLENRNFIFILYFFYKLYYKVK